MTEKILIGIAGIAFLALAVASYLPAVTSPLFNIILAMIIMLGWIFAKIARDKKLREITDRLETENLMITLNFCEAASAETLQENPYGITRRIISFFKKGKNPLNIYLRCAQAIAKMKTGETVRAESEKYNLAPWQKENLERLMRKIDEQSLIISFV